VAEPEETIPDPRQISGPPGATTLLSAGTAIAVAQIFPTATRKFSPSDSIPVAYDHKNCLETVGIVRAVGR